MLRRVTRLSRRTLVIGSLSAMSGQQTSQDAASAKQSGSSWKIGPITVEQAWVRLARSNEEPASVYMIIHNQSAIDDYLLAVETEKAARSEIHETVSLGGSPNSQPVPGGLDMPSHGEIVMRPGGFHVMLTGLSESVTPGEMLPIRMFFREAGMLELNIPVLTEAAPDPVETHTAHGP